MANPHPVCRFAPGRSGNPRGRPPGRTLTTRLRAKLDQVDAETGQTFAELVVDALIWAAIGGDFQACRLILDRVDGKVPTRVQVRNYHDDAARTIALVLDALEGFPEARLAVVRRIAEEADEASDDDREWVTARPEPGAGKPIAVRIAPAPWPGEDEAAGADGCMLFCDAV